MNIKLFHFDFVPMPQNGIEPWAFVTFLYLRKELYKMRLGWFLDFVYTNICNMFSQTETYGPLVWGAKRIQMDCKMVPFSSLIVLNVHSLEGAGVKYSTHTLNIAILCYSHRVY